MNELTQRTWRLSLVAAALAICLLVVAGRLVQMQVIERDRYAAQARDSRQPWREVPAHRGEVRDANGNPLATTVQFETLVADPARVRDPAALSRALAPLVGATPSDLEARLGGDPRLAVDLATGLTVDAADRIRALGLPGLSFRIERRRVHPEGSLASQLLGVTGTDEQGLSGVEGLLDEELAGRPGWVWAERDTAGDEIALAEREETAPEPGLDVTLTIDRYVQRVVERELASAVSRSGAKAGTAIALDPHSGALLAVAASPSFRYDDPSLFAADRVALFNVPAASEVYEPGAAFEVVTYAAALDAGAVKPDVELVDDGSLAYAGGSIRNAPGTPSGPTNLVGGLRRSSNVVGAYVGTALGAERFYDYVAAFGFGRTTDSGLPGESSAPFRRPGEYGWTDFDLATSAIGQGLAVTPVQMVAAIGAVANGGTLMRPYVVGEIGGGGQPRRYHPTIVRQVVRPETARRLTEMLVVAGQTSADGQSSAGPVPGYRVAGLGGAISASSGRGSASYCGFAPADSPRFALLVELDGVVAAPGDGSPAAAAFRTIAEQLLVYFKVPPDQAGW